MNLVIYLFQYDMIRDLITRDYDSYDLEISVCDVSERNKKAIYEYEHSVFTNAGVSSVGRAGTLGCCAVVQLHPLALKINMLLYMAV